MRKSLLITGLMAMTAAGLPACATKGYVRTQVGQVNSKVDSLSHGRESSRRQGKGKTSRY